MVRQNDAVELFERALDGLRLLDDFDAVGIILDLSSPNYWDNWRNCCSASGSIHLALRSMRCSHCIALSAVPGKRQVIRVQYKAILLLQVGF